MAKFNEILTGRFNRALQKSLQLKGGPPAAQLASEIMPTLAHFRGREDRFLESWNLYGSAGAGVATAGIVTGFRLRNPKTSGVLADCGSTVSRPRRRRLKFWGSVNGSPSRYPRLQRQRQPNHKGSSSRGNGPRVRG